MTVGSLLGAGCASTSAVGLGGTTSTTGAGGFTVALNGGMGLRLGDHLDVGLTSNLHMGNWSRVGRAYGAITDWARSGAVDCCGGAGPLLTMFKYIGVGFGYATAWIVATDASLVGPRLRYYVHRYAPTYYVDLGTGPALNFDEDADTTTFGIGATAAVGYMFDARVGLEVRGTWGHANDPQWATFTVGLVVKPKKRFLGLFGKNDLQRPPAPPAPSQPPSQPVFPPESYPPNSPYLVPQPPPASPPPPPPAVPPESQAPSTQPPPPS